MFMNTLNFSHTGVPYNDQKARILITVLVTYIGTTYVAMKNSYEMMLIKEFYSLIIAAFVITFLIINWVYLVTVRLDRYYRWEAETIQRILLQSILAFALPALLFFLLTWIYMSAYGLNMLTGDYPGELNFLIKVLILLNAYYITYYFYLRWRTIEKASQNNTLRYSDRKVRLYSAAIGAFMISVYGETKPIFELMMLKEFYLALVVSFLIAFILINLVYLVTVRLDRQYRWETETIQRLLLQVLLAFIAPAILAFLFAWTYLSAYGINILKTSYVTHDYQFILMMLLLLNAYYLGHYFFLRWQACEQLIQNFKGKINEPGHPGLQLSQGSKTIQVPFEDILYIYREDEANYLLTKNAERYFLSFTLDDIAVQLNQNFFRANRQMIINRKTIKSYQSAENGKIMLALEPPFKEDVLISSRKAKGFRDWIRR